MNRPATRFVPDPMQPESVLAERWLDSIPNEFRAAHLRPGSRCSTPGAQLAERRKSQIRKQARFARACLPETEEEAKIVELFGKGMPVEAVAAEMKLAYEPVRKTLIRCHPTKTSLK